jgi:hypothetical protein
LSFGLFAKQRREVCRSRAECGRAPSARLSRGRGVGAPGRVRVARVAMGGCSSVAKCVPTPTDLEPRTCRTFPHGRSRRLNPAHTSSTLPPGHPSTRWRATRPAR